MQPSGTSPARRITESAAIAALYVTLTWLSSLVGLSGGAIQFRLSEMLCILPCFTPAAIPGLAVGCLLANLLTGALPWDIVIGSAATLLGAVICRLTRKLGGLWAPVPNILANSLIVPLVLMYVYGATEGYLFLLGTVFLGEFVCGGIGGYLLYRVSDRYRGRLFGNS